MQATGRFVQQEESRSSGTLGQVPGQFQSLDFARGEIGDRLAEVEGFQSERHGGSKPTRDCAIAAKVRERLLEIEIQDFGDRESAIGDFENFGYIARATAGWTKDFRFREKLEIDRLEASAFAGGAAPERAACQTESLQIKIASAGFFRGGEVGADRRPDLQQSGGGAV